MGHPTVKQDVKPVSLVVVALLGWKTPSLTVFIVLPTPGNAGSYFSRKILRTCSISFTRYSATQLGHGPFCPVAFCHGTWVAELAALRPWGFCGQRCCFAST